MSTAGGGAAQVIVDILANATGLGQTLQQAEKQVQASAERMGNTMDQAVGKSVGGQGRLAQMFQGKGAMIGGIATQFARSFTDDLKMETERRSDLGDSLGKGLRESLKVIPHWSVQLGLVLAEALEPVGERAGEILGRAMFEGNNMEIENQFEEGTAYGLGDWLSDFVNNRTTREVGRGVRKLANQNLILNRQDELAALQAEQQIMRQTDIRGQMIQSRMHMGMAEFQTGMGTFRAAFGTPEEASARVYDAAMKQVIALERIESIVKEIGHYSRNAMRN
jgi:hypothetical protein